MSYFQKALNQILDRLGEYEKAENYYKGQQEEVFSNQHIRRMLSKTGEDYRLNFCDTVVTAVLNRLEIASITAQSDTANSIVDDLWSDNGLIIEAEDIHRWALVYGDAYVTVWPVGDDVEIFYNNPKTTTIVYDEEFPRVKRVAAKLWPVEEGKRYRLNLYYPDRIERYVSKGKAIKNEQEFLPFDDGDGSVVENPFGEVPVFHFRTERPHGRPEHYHGYGAQDAINKLVITQMNVVDYQGAPQRYALSGNNLNNEITDFNDGDTDRENLGALKNGPGELWYLKGIDEVGQFEPADPKAFLEPLREYVRGLATVTGTPLHYFEKSMVIPSGESLRVAEAPLTKKILNRQQSFGSAWRDVFRFALRIAGVDEDVQVKWQRHEAVDQMTEWDIAIKKVRAGLPLDQIFRELGYDEALVQKWVSEGAFPKIPGLLSPEQFEEMMKEQSGVEITPNTLPE